MAVSSSSPQRLSGSAAEHDDPDTRDSLASNEYEGLSAQSGPVSVTDDQQLATLSHMLGVIGCLPSMIIHRWARGRARFTEQESLEAANFTLLPTLVVIIGAVLAFIPWVGWIFAILAAAAWLSLAISSVAAAVAANSGRPYRYRFNWYLYDALASRRQERRRERETSGPVTAQGQVVTPSGRTADAPEPGAGAQN